MPVSGPRPREEKIALQQAAAAKAERKKVAKAAKAAKAAMSHGAEGDCGGDGGNGGSLGDGGSEAEPADSRMVADDGDALMVPKDGSGPRDERCLLLAASDPKALARTVLADPVAARYVQRWYVIDGAPQPTLAAAAAEIARRLRALGAKPISTPSSTPSSAGSEEEVQEAAVPVRVQTFPKNLELALVEQLRSSGAASPQPKAPLLACAVFLYGAFHVGVAEGGSTAFSVDGGIAGRTGARADEAVSRAYYKLREVAARCSLKLDVQHAVDIGASPGVRCVRLASSG